MSEDTSILCINMIGKVLYTSTDLSPSVWRCYVFCIQCATIHEVQDGADAHVLCPLSQLPITGSSYSYHMMGAHTIPAVPADSQTGHQAVQRALSRRSSPQTSRSHSKHQMRCSFCVSHTTVSTMDVMTRHCEGPGCPVTYMMETRRFCFKHAPPAHLVKSGCFIDSKQLDDFCLHRKIGHHHSSQYKFTRH